MRVMRKFVAMALTALLLGAVATMALAHDVPDLTRKGIITVSLNLDGKPVKGGTMELYRVGDIYNDGDENYSFVPSAPFADCGVTFENIRDPQIAAALKEFIKKHKEIKPLDTQKVSEGTVIFTEVDPGLYLVVQSKASNGCYPADPFLVSVPNMENGTYSYQVDASPKVEIETRPTDPPPATSQDPVLPQTGQTNWPIPMMALLGLTLFSLGWFLCYGRRETEEN